MSGYIEPLDANKDPFNQGWNLPEGHLTVEDEKALFRYGKDRKLAVNIGTFKGRSAALLSYVCKKVYTVDYFPFENVQPAEFLYDQICEDMKKYNVTVIKDISTNSAKQFQDKTIDFLFQDAGHSKGGVIEDFKAFRSKLTPDAIIIFHDYKYMDGREADKDVQGGVQYLLDQGWIEKIDILGWCFIAKLK